MKYLLQVLSSIFGIRLIPTHEEGHYMVLPAAGMVASLAKETRGLDTKRRMPTDECKACQAGLPATA